MKTTTHLASCLLTLAPMMAAAGEAQSAMSAVCAAPDVYQSVPAGDKTDHMFNIAQGKCTPKAEVGGTASKQGVWTEHEDAYGGHSKGWGVYVETYENGDKVFYTYEITATLKHGALQRAAGTMRATGGTGKMKGIKANYNCTWIPGPNDTVILSCNGSYTLAEGLKPATQTP